MMRPLWYLEEGKHWIKKE